MHLQPHKGLFITFEGGDGAGKSTLLDKVLSHLKIQGHDVLKTRAPGGTPLGQEIRTLLLEKRELSLRAELLLFLADRAQHVQEVILPALSSGKIVLCDRFNDSTFAYQAGARGFPLELVKSLCSFASHELVPDLTFYLDIAPEIGLERAKKAKGSDDRIEGETLAFHQKIREAFLSIHKQEPRRMHLLDGTLPPDVVFEKAKEALRVCASSRT